MPTASPISVTTVVVESATGARWETSAVAPIAPATAVTPSTSGTHAATSAPKAIARMISVIGSEIVSARLRS